MTEEKNIPYEEFVIGLAQGTTKFEVTQKSNFASLYNDTFVVLIMRILLFLVIAPIIAIPVLSYLFDKWTLLFGFLGLFFGLIFHGISMKTSRPIKNLVTSTFSFGATTAVLIYFLGILNPFTFTFTCMLYQFFFLNFSDNIYDEIAKNNLIKDTDNYYFATENNIVKTFRIS